MDKIYKNYNELLDENNSLASELLNDKGKGKWQVEEIYSHSDIQTFAEYELTEGWYIDLKIDRDFNGAPNPLDFIDLEELGMPLLEIGTIHVILNQPMEKYCILVMVGKKRRATYV